MSQRYVERNFDGAVMGSTDSLRDFRVFAPAWWQVWRWWTYWRATSRGHVTVTFMGRAYTLRCIAVPPRYRRR